MAGQLGSGVEIVPIRPYSDGTVSHCPKPDWRRVDPPTRWLEVLGGLWMAARGEAVPGRTYYLDRLPDGYNLYERGRPANPKIVDKHLYGHPKRKFFDSANRFFPHFRHLMDTGSNENCPCTVCQAEGRGAPLSMSATATPRGPGRPPKLVHEVAPSGPVDHEGTPDPYRRLINKLKTDGKVDEAITEEQSMDWLCERDLLPSYLKKLLSQKSWIPRVGEVVLFVRTLQGRIGFTNGRAYEFLDTATTSRTTIPEWEAGVVTQVPANAPDLPDLKIDTHKSQSVNYTGFRVEPLPDPNGKNKALSKQYTYVLLHQLRPFVFHLEYLDGVPSTEWHPTIEHALKVTSSFSLLEKYHFTGTWPTATIHCMGIFIGHELISIGDVVRLRPAKPSNNESIQDVLFVSGIRLVLSKLDAANDNDADESHPYNSAVYLTGKAFTFDKSRVPTTLSRQLHDPSVRSSSFLSSYYEGWYPLHADTQLYKVPFSRVVGRLYEPPALQAWFPHLARTTSLQGSRHSLEDLSLGSRGLLAARTHASKSDSRILPGRSWFWADSRGEALGLETFNGVELAAYDPSRNPQRWRRWMNAAAKEKETVLAVAMQKPGAPSLASSAAASSGKSPGEAVVIDDASSDTSMGTAVEQPRHQPVVNLDEYRSAAGNGRASASQEPVAKRMKMAVVVPQR